MNDVLGLRWDNFDDLASTLYLLQWTSGRSVLVSELEGGKAAAASLSNLPHSDLIFLVYAAP